MILLAGSPAASCRPARPCVNPSIATTNSIWHVLVFGASAVFLLAVADARMTAPLLVWFILFLILLRVVVPQMRDRSRGNSEARSTLTGRIVDSYSNILTVKLFARARDEDEFVREALDAHTKAFQHQQRLMTLFGLALSLLNGALLAGSAAMALSMWSAGRITVGVVAMTLQLAWQLNGLSWSVAQNVTSIFEAVGAVQDGMRSIAAPQQMPDPKSARALQVSKGEIAFENVSFGYGDRRAVLRNLDLTIRGGERIGLIGHSAAGKSTLVNLLLHFYDVSSGVIRIDGQDIAGVTQESLRGHIAMVTQDTSLLHRSIRDNIRYGRQDATEEEIRRAAAAAAHALEFIEKLEDSQGRRGFIRLSANAASNSRAASASASQLPA